MHGKRAVIEAERKLTVDEVVERACDYDGCERIERLSQHVPWSCTRGGRRASAGDNKPVWLLVEEWADGEIQLALSNLPVRTKLVVLLNRGALWTS